jgi:hypothetical protein
MSPFLETLSLRRILISRPNAFLQHRLLLIYSTGVGWANIVRQRTERHAPRKIRSELIGSPELAANANFSFVSRGWTCGLPLLEGHG